MSMLALSWRYLWARPLASVLNLLLLSLGLAAITLVLLVRFQIDRAFERDLAGIDAVVGAKGSPLQLILAGVFHLDIPPGNIRLSEARALAKDARVASLIPLSLGDSVGGFRIVGTTPDYLTHYGAEMAQGQIWQQPMQAVLGAQAARGLGLPVGADFAGSHGMGGGGANHADHAYRVSGVLAPCACVLDRLVLTATESVWEVHEAAHAPVQPAAEKSVPGAAKSHPGHPHDEAHAKDDQREITLALVRYSSPLAAASFPRFVNSQTGMQAAAPALEISRLLRMLGVGMDVLRGFGLLLLVVAALSVFIALWSAVRERRADLAMLRMLGASPAKLAGLLLCEALWLALLASLLGLLGGHLLTAGLGWMLQTERSLAITPWFWSSAEGYVPALAVGVAVMAAWLPAWSAYRAEAGQLLNSR